MKLFEKFVHNQLYHFVTDYNLLSSNQSGFRAMHSTQTCLLEVTDYLLDNFNSGLYTGVVFLDLKKAFDTVHHKVLLNKLQSIGVQGSELNWFESYLSNRQQVTKIGDFMSSPAFVNFGVPQGSILGPLLFTLYINSLSSVITNSNAKVTLYADDTAIFVKGKSVSNINDIMNTEISKVAKWLNENFLTLNAKKTKGMLLCNSQKMTRRDTDLEVYINNSLIDNVGKFKYLGVWLDPALTWNEQIDKISKTVSKRNGLLRRLRKVLPQKNLNMLYKALILPHLDYCDAVWGNAGKTQLKILDRLQNAAGKIILGLPRRYPTEILLNTLRWDKLEYRRNFHLNVLVYKSLTNSLPSPLCNIFLPVSNSHGHKTRSASNGNLVPPTNRSVSAKRKFASRGATSFNLLPTMAKNPLPATVGLFKRACRL